MNWLQRLLRSERMEQELEAELRFHFELQIADKMQSGMTEAEARRSARLEFGGLEQVKQDCRESRGTLWVASIVQAHFDWFDAAVLSHQLGQHLAKELKAFLPKKAA